jgi:hypothetical protein
VEFSIIGEVSGEQTFASGSGIREIGRLRKSYGPRRWRKRRALPPCSLQMAAYAEWSYTGTKPQVLAAGNTRSSDF